MKDFQNDCIQVHLIDKLKECVDDEDAILSVNCLKTIMKKMKKKLKKESTEKIVEHDEFSYNVYYC